MALTAVDASLLVPALAPWHAEHRRADELLGQTANLRMLGHVLLETCCWCGTSSSETLVPSRGSVRVAPPAYWVTAMPTRVRVPASVANLGPGFDVLALAVDLAGGRGGAGR